ncbi:IS5 family transposase [Frankia sp. KB5]|uniref:IS5 family transposase n=1 Tax=Frankia sp. KB5 TaxID=683318 RepID=UPI000A116112|nr:IS5 family transposase [Frankia sp. KB5]ORT46913.1 IS5 family transposase [Frankia sp. KB5]
MTDAQWAVIEPLLPLPGSATSKGGRPEKWPRRTVLDAIFYLVRGGIAWAQLPHDFPPPKTIYDIYRRWATAGVWQRVHDCLRDVLRVHAGRDPLPTAAIVDSQTVRAADTVPSSTAGYDAGKKTKGRKRHIATDTNGLLLAVVVTAASIQDRDGAHRVLAALRDGFGAVRHVWADGGYAGRLVTWAAKTLNLTVQIVKRTDNAAGFVVLPRRWVVERTYGWINKHRRCVRDYETSPESHEAMVYIAMIMVMSRRLGRTGDW